MSQFKRRHFLQLAGSTLASIGLSQTDFLSQCDRYGKALAQSTPRKLALLIGINSYPSPLTSLQGCINDVYLQRELLIHRFGFNPNDIMVLTNNTEIKPTRANILQAFQTHLIAKAKPDDVVVFHYSGHGSQVIDPNPIQPGESFRYNGTLVPMDATPLAEQDNGIVVPDIMGQSLFLLTKSINTDNLTMVLDSCYAGASTRGGSAVRADTSRLRRWGVNLFASEAEFELQRSLLIDLKISEEEFHKQRQQGIAKGVALGSASREQEALDRAFPGFNAGAFTYLLTRYLWQLTASEVVTRTEINLQRSTRIAASQHGLPQVPVFEYAKETYKTAGLYFSEPLPAFAEAVITNITGEQIEFWLGGTSVQNMEADETLYTLVRPDGQVLMADAENPMVLKKISRNGLYGYGNLIAGNLGDIGPGILLREQVLGLPPNPTLKVHVDTALGDQSTDAKAALETVLLSTETGINRLEVNLLTDVKPKDYIFGQFTSNKQTKLSDVSSVLVPDKLPPLGSLGLFTPQEIPVTNTFGFVNESVTAAVERLQSKLKLFLAEKILRGLASGPSRLEISGEIFTSEQPEVKVPITTATAIADFNRVSVDIPAFKTNESILIRIDNHDPNRALYLSCVAIDSQGNLIILYPGDWDLPEDAARINENSSLIVPRPEDGIKFKVSGTGFLEILTMVSTQPLRNTLKGLQSIARSRGLGGNNRGLFGTRGDEALEVLDDLLGDLDSLSRGDDATIQTVSTATSRDRSAWDTGVLAAFSTAIEIVN